MEYKCFNCSYTLPSGDNVFYCPSCMTQIKCKKCSTELLKGAIGCVTCGTKIDSVVNENASQLNQIEFEQKGDSKKFKASFTDNVGHELVATFGGMVGAGLPKRKLFSLNQTKNPMTLEIGDGTDVEDIDFTDDTELTEALNRVFKVDGESIIIQTTNFKTKSKLNIEKRIALLILLGYKYLHSSEEIKRQVLTDTLKKFKYNSAGFRTWILKSEEIGQKSGGMIFLTPNGLDAALEILKEVTNPNITESTVKLSIGGVRKRNKEGASDKKSSKGPKDAIMLLIDENYFNERRTVSEIVKHLKVDKAMTFAVQPVSVAISRLLNKNGLKRELGASGYEYFI